MSDLSQLFASSLPIEVKPSKPKYALLLVVCIALTVFLLWTLIHGQERSAWRLALFASVTSLGAMACIFALVDKRPLVLLDQHGVTVRGWKGCPVAWTDIEGVWKHEQRVQALWAGQVQIDYVCMAFHHSKQWRNKQGAIKRKVASYYHAGGWGDMYFPTKGMNYEADELVAAIQSHIGGERLSAPASLLPGAASPAT